MELESLSLQKRRLQEKISSAKEKIYQEGFRDGVEESFKQFQVAIKMYKKYKDNVKLLMEEQNKVWKKWIEYYEKQSNINRENFLQRYNEWLFRYIFESEKDSWMNL